MEAKWATRIVRDQFYDSEIFAFLAEFKCKIYITICSANYVYLKGKCLK